MPQSAPGGSDDLDLSGPPASPPDAPAVGPTPGAEAPAKVLLQVTGPAFTDAFEYEGIRVGTAPTPVPVDKVASVIEAANKYGITIEEGH